MKTDHFSPAGKQWLRDVRRELQVALDGLPSDLTCDQVKSQAFDQHVPVYEKTGFCDIAAADRIQVYLDLHSAVLTNPGALANGLDVLKACGAKDIEKLKKELDHREPNN